MNLYIDTVNSEKIMVAVVIGRKKLEEIASFSKDRSQAVLPLIEMILMKYNRKLSDITAIQVAPGPGSYTGIRVGLAVANALSVLLSVPINGQPPGTLPSGVYKHIPFRL